MENEELFKNKKRQIWQWCIIIILAFFIVMQFSLAHCNDEVLSDQFTFASTISSIILSVIAIIMTVVSSDSVNNLLHKFRDLHNEIKDEPQKIDISVGKMVDVTTRLNESMDNVSTNISKIDHSVTEVSNASINLSTAVEQINTVIKVMNASILGMDTKLSGMDKRIEEGFNHKMSEQQISIPHPGHVAGENALLNAVKYYLLSSSWIGLNLLYAVSLFFKEKKNISIDELSKIIELGTPDYMFGYFVSSSCFQLFDYESVKSEGNVFVITSFDNEYIQLIEQELERRINEKGLPDEREKIEKLLEKSIKEE